VAESGDWDVGDGQSGTFPQETRGALACVVEAFDVEGVQAGAEAQGASVITHCVACHAANLRKGRPGLRYFHAVDDYARAIASEKVKGVASVDRHIERAVPRRGVAGESMWIDLKAR
jgi:mono/diheme cytochrome c family protein